MSNPTRYVGAKEYEATQKHEQFKQLCQAKAAGACEMLRKQLKEQEIIHLIPYIRHGIPISSLHRVFTTPGDLKNRIDKEAKEVIDGKS
jgi:hypothetical protein